MCHLFIQPETRLLRLLSKLNEFIQFHIDSQKASMESFWFSSPFSHIEQQQFKKRIILCRKTSLKSGHKQQAVVITQHVQAVGPWAYSQESNSCLVTKILSCSELPASIEISLLPWFAFRSHIITILTRKRWKLLLLSPHYGVLYTFWKCWERES